MGEGVGHANIIGSIFAQFFWSKFSTNSPTPQDAVFRNLSHTHAHTHAPIAHLYSIGLVIN